MNCFQAIAQDRKKTYVLVVNLVAQLAAIGTGLQTSAELGRMICFSLCVPFNVLLIDLFRGGSLRTQAIWGGGIGMVFLFITGWLEGGIRSSTASWFIVVVMVVYFLMGTRAGFWALVGVVGLLVTQAFIDWQGWSLDPSMPPIAPDVLSIMSLTDFLSVTLVIFAIPWIYENTIEERLHAIRERQQALEHKQQELEHILLLRDRFIASVSHELRTPMNAILGLNQLLMLRTQDRPQAYKVLEYTQQSADHLMTVINDVLDYSQFSTGELTAQNEPFELRELIDAAYGLFTPRVENTGVRYERELADDLPQWVMSDRHRLMQVLVNLLGNAFKFTAQGEVRLQVLRVSEGVEFAVQDTGIGIAPENQERVFERYSQVDDPSHSHPSGTGLGLTISRKLVAMLGGQLNLSSQVGQGSRFWFRLPLREVDPRTVANHQAESNKTLVLPPARFLVVDDQVINRKLVRLILNQYCPEGSVVEAIHGEDALERLAQQGFDAVIMDMVMPGIDGIEATQRIRASDDERLRNLPILGLTANVTPSDLRRFVQAGINDIMLKPFQVERFVAAVSRVLVRRPFE
jgi:signal transduction histidine kinase/ActR/RegA family two-component response regulator